MKKLGLLVVSGVLGVIMLTGCCSHTFKAATCEEPEICKECGETQASPRGHDWSEANCEEPEICKECGKTRGEALGHNFSEATCVEPEICSVCGGLGESALGHNWIEATYDAPSTCTVCKMTRGEKLTPVSSWGFEFLWEMDNMIIEIEEAPIITEEGTYIQTYGSARRFIDGSLYYQDLTEKDGGYVFEDTRSPRTYQVADNDNLLINGGSRSMRIKGRDSFGIENFVLLNIRTKGFQSSDSLYVPSSLLDWEKGIQKTTDKYGYPMFIIYLK